MWKVPRNSFFETVSEMPNEAIERANRELERCRKEMALFKATLKRANKSLDKCFRILSAIRSENLSELRANNQQLFVHVGKEVQHRIGSASILGSPFSRQPKI